ncbi:MAG: hypothetical protein Q8909_10440 [Bacteroidota bacterium]|nr:hypothetical protein [Bacteroidota bacterium]
MKREQIVCIPDNLDSAELLSFLYQNQSEENQSKTSISLLIKICKANLTDFHNTELIENLRLSEEEKEFIHLNNWINSNNLVLKARICDLMRHFEKDKRQITVVASDCYYESYNKIRVAQDLFSGSDQQSIQASLYED